MSVSVCASVRAPVYVPVFSSACVTAYLVLKVRSLPPDGTGAPPTLPNACLALSLEVWTCTGLNAACLVPNVGITQGSLEPSTCSWMLLARKAAHRFSCQTNKHILARTRCMPCFRTEFSKKTSTSSAEVGWTCSACWSQYRVWRHRFSEECILYTRTQVCACVCVWVCACVHACVRLFLSVCVCVCLFVCLLVCLCLFVCLID